MSIDEFGKSYPYKYEYTYSDEEKKFVSKEMYATSYVSNMINYLLIQ